MNTKIAALWIAPILLLASATTGCRTTPRADRILYTDDRPAPALDPVDRFESPAPDAPADDLPESERIRWHEENRSPRGHRPRQGTVVPVVTERVVVREVPRREVRYVERPWYDVDRWYVPVTLGLSYGAWRHHRRHHGRHNDWGVRIGWALDPWCW